ncbi:MAG: hypothetical protein H8E54_11280 [Candidatus Aminicenantes bacterium]|nr:hypothetical protein [Candidatus Aminicenantes bacterium]
MRENWGSKEFPGGVPGRSSRGVPGTGEFQGHNTWGVPGTPVIRPPSKMAK